MYQKLPHWNLAMLGRVLTCLLVVPALTLLMAAPAAAEGKKLALLVGVEQYKHADLTPLKFCCDDIKKMAGLLTAQGFTCRVLADEGFDANLAASQPEAGATGPLPSQGLPTRTAITSELKMLLDDVGQEDLVLIVLSGHGLQPDGASQPFFCPLDANPSTRLETVSNPGGGRVVRKLTRPETLVGIGDLLGQLKESGVGQKLILVDACRNSPSYKGTKSVGASSVSINLIPEMCSVLMSCSAGEQSFEDRKFGPEGGGAFLTAVMEGLEGLAADAEGAVSWDGLVAHVKKRVKSSVQAVYNGTERQTPNQIQNSSADPVLAMVAARPAAVGPPPAPTPPPVPPSAWKLDFAELEDLEDSWKEIGDSTFYLRKDIQPHGLCPTGSKNGVQQIEIPLDRSLLADSWSLEVDFWSRAEFEIDLPGFVRCPISVDRDQVWVAGTPSTKPDIWPTFLPNTNGGDTRLAMVRFEYIRKSGRLTISLRRMDNGQFTVFVVLKPPRARLDTLRLALGKSGTDVSVVSAIRIEAMGVVETTPPPGAPKGSSPTAKKPSGATEEYFEDFRSVEELRLPDGWVNLKKGLAVRQFKRAHLRTFSPGYNDWESSGSQGGPDISTSRLPPVTISGDFEVELTVLSDEPWQGKRTIVIDLRNRQEESLSFRAFEDTTGFLAVLPGSEESKPFTLTGRTPYRYKLARRGGIYEFSLNGKIGLSHDAMDHRDFDVCELTLSPNVFVGSVRIGPPKADVARPEPSTKTGTTRK